MAISSDGPNPVKGALFVFEGANEVGKSTLASLVYVALRAKNIACELTAFPGNQTGTLGRHVYEIHHRPELHGIQQLDPTALQALHVAAHIDAIDRVIAPALAVGKVIILDRFWWSTWVYGNVKGANPRTLQMLIDAERNHWGGTLPRQTFLVTRRVPVTRVRRWAG